MGGEAAFNDLGTSDHPVWWYQEDDETKGPVSASDLQSLFRTGALLLSSLVWREEFGDQWKRLDQTGIQAPEPVGVRPPPLPQYDPKWRSAFEAAEREEKAWSLANKSGDRLTGSDRLKIQWRLKSIPGFLIGPLYYFYLKMWRKGIILLALLPVMFLIENFFGTFRFFDFLIPLICMTMAKRDYYKLRVKGEVMWPFLRFSKSAYTDAALVLGITAVAGTLVFFIPSSDDVQNNLLEDVAGVWKSDDMTLGIDIDGSRKTLSINGRVVSVAIKTVDNGDGIVVVQINNDPSKLMTFRRRYSDDKHSSFSLTMSYDDQAPVPLAYIRPLS